MKTIILILLLTSQGFAAVKSTGGNVYGDSNRDGTPEFQLNTTGLGIGMVPSSNLSVNGNAIVSRSLIVGNDTNLTGSNLHVSGTSGISPQMLTSSNTSLHSSTVLVDSSSDNITIHLPDASEVSGRIYWIKKMFTANEVYIYSPKIDDLVSILLPSNSNASVKLYSDGVQWWMVSHDNSLNYSPVSSSNLLLWLDASDLDGDGQEEGLSEAGLTGNVISTWVDKSGVNGNASATSSPVYIPSATNGRSVVRFDGVDDTFTFASSINTIRTVFWVIYEDSATDNNTGPNFLLGDTPTNYHFERNKNSAFWDNSYTHANILGGQTYLDNNLVSDLTTGPPMGRYGVVSLVTSGDVTASTLSQDRTFTERSWHGDIAEVLIYNTPLSDSERENVQNYLSAKWLYGIGVSHALAAGDSSATLGTGDNITINFNRDGNQPDVSSKAKIDTIIDFGNKVFWTDYSGSWISASQLLITAVGAGSGNLEIGDSLTFKTTSELKRAWGIGGLSADTVALQGNWGLSGFNPNDFGSVALWMDGADIDGDGAYEGLSETGLTSGNQIVTWKDKSPSRNHLTASSAPVIVPTAVSGNSVVRFDGVDDTFSFAHAITTIRTVFWVVNENASTDNNADGANFLLGDIDKYHFHRHENNSIWRSSSNAFVKTSGSTYLDGAAVDGLTTPPPMGSYGVISLVTGGYVIASSLSKDRGNANRSWHGDIAEVIIYHDALSDANRQSVEAALKAKWGTP